MDADAKAHAAVLGDARPSAGRARRWIASAETTAPLAVSNTASTESPAMSMTRPLVGVDRRAEHRARGVERRDRAALVAAHQARVAGDVGHQDRGQALPRCRTRSRRSPRESACSPMVVPIAATAVARRAGQLGHGRAIATALAVGRATRDRLTMAARVARFQSAADAVASDSPPPSAFDWRSHDAGSRPMNPGRTPMSFDTLGLAEPLLRAVHEAGLHHPHPDPGAGHSRRALRRRRHGRRPDRHRQDRRLRRCRCCSA